MGLAGTSGGEQLQALAVRLRAAGSHGRGLRSRMRRNIIAAVKPMQDAVKQQITEIPSKGHPGPSLRAAMVKNTKIRIRASGSTALVRLEVAPLPGNAAALPAYMNGEGDWWHPVYGNTHAWAHQDAHPYFDKAVRPRLVNVRLAVEAAVRETAASI